MVNECILVGYISTKPERSRAENGFEFSSVHVEVTEPRPDGSAWRSFIPVAVFGKQAEQLTQFCPGNLIVIKGRVGWTTSDGLCVTARSVEQLVFEDLGEGDAA